MTELIDILGLWPEGCADQETYLNQLVSILNTKWLEIQNGASRVLTISQTIEPTQAQWESQWIIQTGNPLPIPSSAVLVWYNTTLAKIGGVYGTAAGYSVIGRREHQYPIGSTVYLNRASLYSAQSITTSIVSNNAVMPTLTLTLTQKAHLMMEFMLGVTCTVNCGIDFMVNGTKIGTSEFGLAPDAGLANIGANGILHAKHVMLNLIPGTYVVQAMFGLVNGGAGTLTIGGPTALGGRNLIVRAIAAP